MLACSALICVQEKEQHPTYTSYNIVHSLSGTLKYKKNYDNFTALKLEKKKSILLLPFYAPV